MATRTIHTGLYGAEAFRIVDAVWNEVLKIYGDKRNTERAKSVLHTTAKQADDNELVFECESIWKYSSKPAFSGWNDKRILEHIAWEIKCAVLRRVEWAHDDVKKAWKRRNSAMYQFPNSSTGRQIPVSKIYFIYDKLRGRSCEKRYPAEYVDELTAMPLDPIMTEMKIAQKEEIKKLEEQLSLTIRKLNNECYAEKERMRIEISNKYGKLVDAAKVETANKIKALKAEMDSFGNEAVLIIGQ